MEKDAIRGTQRNCRSPAVCRQIVKKPHLPSVNLFRLFRFLIPVLVFLVDNIIAVMILNVTITFFVRFLQNGGHLLILSTLFNTVILQNFGVVLFSVFSVVNGFTEIKKTPK